MIFARLSAEVAQIFYIFLLKLPLAYYVMVPLYTMAICFLLAQEIWYSTSRMYKTRVSFGIGAIVIAALIGLLYALLYPVWTGNIAGWVYVSILVFAQLPQAYQNYTRQSVHGFSLQYTLLMASGASIELVLAVLLQLPIQTLVDLVRALCFYSIYWYQFIVYREKSVEEIEVI